jgi:heptosyltransferase-1
MNRFLIVKTSAIGDIIQTFPVLAYLRARFPGAQIDWVVERAHAPLVAAHPDVTRVLCVDTRKWRKNPFSRESRVGIKAFKQELQHVHYDAVFDFQGNTKSAFVTFLAKAKEKVGFGFSSVPEKPNLLVTNRRFEIPQGINVRARYLKLVQAYFRDEQPFQDQPVELKLNAEELTRLKGWEFPTPTFMVAFGSKWENKRLDQKTLTEFLQLMDQKYHPFFVFVWGNEEEKQVAIALQALFPEKSVCVGELSLPLWQALMRKVELVIAMDSAALHLCGTTNTPSFSVFGPSSSEVYKPSQSHHVAVQGTCPYGKTFEKRCPLLRTCKTGSCIKAFSGQTLFDSFPSNLFSER